MRDTRSREFDHTIETERLWQEYAAVRQRAQTSNDIRDGIAAGRAWAAFVSAFCSPSRAVS